MMESNGTFSIHEVTAEKFDEIWPIFEEVLQGEDTYPYLKETTKEEARGYWFAPSAHVYHGYLSGAAVASRYIVPNKTGLGSHVANTGVMVDSRYRGRGLGRRMLAFGIAKAKELGFKAIQLNLVVSTNTASITLCKEFGFETVGVLPEAFYYKRQRYVDAYVMYKHL